MKMRARREVLKLFVLLLVSSSMIGFSILNPLKSEYPILFPMISFLDPVQGELKNYLVISEVMVNPAGTEPGHEWMEIYNRSPNVINLGNFKIGDSESRNDLEGMYQFPAGTLIIPGEVLVIANQSTLFLQFYGFQPDFELSDSSPDVPNLVKYKSWSGGVINLSNTGDELLLIDQDDNRVDAVSWGNSGFGFDPPVPAQSDGMSIERLPAYADRNQAGDWIISDEPKPGTVSIIIDAVDPNTPTTTQADCGTPSVLFSEVLYDPAFSGEPDGEWLEIYNHGDSELALACLRVGDEETKSGTEGMMAFPVGASLHPGGVIVVANEAETFIMNYGFSPDFEIRESNEFIPNLVPDNSWGSGSISLNNSGDELLMIDRSGNQLDAVSWKGSNYAFDPPVPGVDPGHSIARQPANLDSDSAADWIDLEHPHPGIVSFNPPITSPTPQINSPTPKTPSLTPTITKTTTVTRTPQPTYEIVINEILADPHSETGDANNDGDIDLSDDEFIELVNYSNSALDIGGWSVGDVLSIRHTFQNDTILLPGCGLLLFGGGSPNGNFGNSIVDVATSGKLALNDNLETVYIYDEQINIVSSVSYGEEANDGQSITRDPDIYGGLPLRKHSLATGSEGSQFSPGTMIDGTFFSGCAD